MSNPVSPRYGFVPTLTLLQKVQAALEGLQLGAPFTPGPAFAKVHAYAHENLAQAMQDLLIFDDRACLIVPTGTSHTNQREGRVFTARQETEFVLLICDRVYGGQFEAEALLGNADTPGMVALADLVVAALSGQSFDLAPVCLQPTGGQPIPLSPTQRAALREGRECWAQTFTTPTGEIRVDRPRAGLTS